AWVDLPSAEPHIHISSMPNGEQNVHITLFCPTDKAVHLEQDIRKDFMELYDQKFAETK
ncbi:mechanosensitive ion channel family protein, partial [Vibrio campbellii]